MSLRCCDFTLDFQLPSALVTHRFGSGGQGCSTAVYRTVEDILHCHRTALYAVYATCGQTIFSSCYRSLMPDTPCFKGEGTLRVYLKPI